MRSLLILITIGSLLAVAPLSAEQIDLNVYGEDQDSQDPRLGPPKDLNGYFPFDVPDTQDAWGERAEKIRQRILVSCGLWPMPERPAIDAKIHGRIDRDDYSVERVYFESYPGLYVTGSLYRPKGKTKPCPVVLSPHGHWDNGRFYECDLERVREQQKDGAERFEVAGRFPLQARCVHLARMGCIVFHYDMLGYADSKPITYHRAHRHSEPRPELENTEAWGLYTAQAEMRMQNVFGLQTFNSLRALDFVTALPDADPTRIGVTGASGGGTQTMILAAIDPRVTVSFPAVMVSTAMQGGCTCENAACLRVDTGNIEFAAMFCPKPQGITAADDWTVELATKGLPELKRLYKLFGSEQNVEGYSLVQFPHNYNHVSRGKMYDWMNRHLKLGMDGVILERNFEPLSVDQLTVWNNEHPAPPSDLAAEQTLLRTIAKLSDDQLATSAKSPREHKALIRSTLETITATHWDESTKVSREKIAKIDRGTYWLFKDILRNSDSALPVVSLYPKDWKNKIVVWSSDRGKQSLLETTGGLRAEVTELLNAGFAIVAADLFHQGEFLDGEPLKKTRRVDNDRDFAGYTFGYNRTLLGHRVHDLLTVLKFIVADDRPTERITLLAVEGATPYASVTAAIAHKQVDELAIDDGAFRFANIKSWRDPNFMPGAIKYGDLAGILVCANKVRTAEDASTAIRQLLPKQAAGR